RLPGEWIEIDSIGHVLHIAETIGVSACQNLFDYGDRLVEEAGRRDRFRDLLAGFGLVGEGGRIDHRIEQRGIRVRARRDEFLRPREGAARMSVPDLL